jgi:hypothetical protein
MVQRRTQDSAQQPHVRCTMMLSLMQLTRSVSLSLSLSLSIYINIYMYLSVIVVTDNVSFFPSRCCLFA